MDFASLLPVGFEKEVIQWLKDDCPSFDVGGFVVGEKEEIAYLYCKQSCVLAGVPFANAIFRHLDLNFTWNVEEGREIDASAGKVVIATIKGKCRHILLGERTSLNIISRASGIATAARRANDIKTSVGWHGYIAGTRKTTPGFRTVEKYALIVGGVSTHRLDLSQMVMLKDNHIWSCGNITNAVKKARLAAGFSSKIEVECQSVEEGLEAAAAGADIVMLDNFTEQTIHSAAAAIKAAYPTILIEASGGITEATMPLFMSKSVDIISRGPFTQGYDCIDFSMKIIPTATALVGDADC